MITAAMSFDIQRLAGSTAGDVHATGALLSTSDGVTRPSPVGARSLTAKYVVVETLSSNGTLDVLDGKTGDRDTSGGLAGRRAVQVVLLDDDTVLGDVLEGDVLVGDTGDGTSGARDGLNADTVVGVDDGGVGDDDVLDDIVGAAADGADGDTVTAGAGSASELDVGTGVDSEAVVLVLDVGVGNVDTGGAADVESVGVVAAVGLVTGGVVDGDVVKGDRLGSVDRKSLDGCVLDVQVRNGGRGHAVGVEELEKLVIAQQRFECQRTLGFVLPPLVPLPSHHFSPAPLMTWPAAPVTLRLVPETEIRGPSHSL
jgi:hypothetical protein